MLKPNLFLSLLVTVLMITSCREKKATTLFSLLDHTSTGIDFKNQLFEGQSLNVMNYAYFYNGGGVAVGDINNDGFMDLLFTGNMVKNRLFLNKGNFTFEDITDKSGIASQQGWCTGATMADVNEDGKMDIYICRSADMNSKRRSNLLFINNGDLTFTERGALYGLDDKGYSTQALFTDYDKDGDLDLFVINHSLQQYTSGVQENIEIRNKTNPDFANRLYRNDQGTFTDVSTAAGIVSNVLSFGLGIAAADLNNDGWTDVYISNDFNEPDYLYINNCDGTFSERLEECMDHISMFSMGSDIADYNNDAFPDVMTLDMLPEDNRMQKMHSGAENFDKMQLFFNSGFYYQFSRNMLHKNNGDGSFSEVGQIAGISNTDWSWASLFSDFDNDGHKDLFVTNGYVKDYTDLDFIRYSADEAIRLRNEPGELAVGSFISKMPTIEIPNYIFHNLGNGRFAKKTNEWGLDQKVVSSGAAYVDLDNDGDMDLVVNNTNAYAGIYRNNSEKLSSNHFIKIKLWGDKKNYTGVGAKISVYCHDTVYFQQQMPVRGFQSSVDPDLIVGIGQNQTIDSIIIIWPDDKMEKITNLKADQVIMLEKKNAETIWKPPAERYDQRYFSKAGELGYAHTENSFNDFTIQSLLPGFLSRQGPCMASADINGDGVEDIFIGGAKGHRGEVFIGQTDGRYRKTIQPAFNLHTQSEDVAAAFFDADGDSDYDLYVGSGGYEFSPDDPALKDRLYLNDGRGMFYYSEQSLPLISMSTGCVKPADINNDGHTDLFVGARLVPGRYPDIPQSRILINKGEGKFSDATESICPSVANIGMVTDAAWIDLNKDKKPDLVVVGEWMPVKIYINENGKLHDRSEDYLKFGSTGWWNRIHSDDYDGDGDQDLVIGNLGLNAQFRASEKEPVTLYYKDFDGNGSIDPVMCYFINRISYPAISRDDLTDQLPGLKKKFLSYSAYADATIDDVFEKKQLEDARMLKAEILETIYLQNDGGSFSRKELPVEVQYAPVYAINSTDVNGDGNKDLLLAGNNTWTRIRYSHYNANHGILLIGNGRGDFQYVPQTSSGLKFRGNVRSMSILKHAKKNHLVVGFNDRPVEVWEIK